MKNLKTFFMTDIGKVRQHNEDSGKVLTNSKGDTFAIVADGMGGHLAGDVASSMAVQHLEKLWEKANIATPMEAEQWLSQSVSYVNKQLYEHSKNHMECEGMGTTLVTAICTPEFITIGHIGDSRFYSFSGGELKQITEDHSLVNELLRYGEITKEDAEGHPKKNVLLRALGTEEASEFDVKTIEYEADAMLVLCSDGLSNKVSSEAMQEILKRNISIEEKGQSLVQLANDLGGEDNITIILIDYTVSEEESG